MTCAGLTKLLVVLLVAFILCLPEFFSSLRGLKVSFRCESAKSCSDESDGDCGRSVGLWVRGQPICRGEENGTEHNTSSYWLLCETHTNLTNLFQNSSLVEPLQVSLVVQIASPMVLNVSFHHDLDNSSLLIKSSEHLQGLFHCCRSLNQSENQQNLTSALSHCFLHARQPANHTAAFQFPQQMKRSGRCVSTLVWLALVLSVISIIVVAVLYQALCKQHLRRRVERHPDSTYQPSRLIIRRTTSLDDTSDLSLQHRDSTGDVFSEVPSLEEDGETLFTVYRCKKGLSPIHEIENYEITAEKEEFERPLLLTADFTHSQWGPLSQLHHRGHPPCISMMCATREEDKQ